ncbi:MAG: 2-oxoglutarate dehydrogenase complex dihydrolipoyllysine-residue succinyltransferase [Candidatus Latescibacterota bacterium]
MVVDVEIPGMGESVSEVILVEWLKEEGAWVDRDEPICVLETDKANVDLPSPAAGVLHRLKEVDASLEVGEVIARVEEAEPPADASAPAAERLAPREQPQVPGRPDARAPDGKAEAEPAGAEETEPGPAVRRLLAEHGLEAQELEGTGRGGRLTKEDVLAYLEAQRPKPARKPREERPRKREREAPPPRPAPETEAAVPWAPPAEPSVSRVPPRASQAEAGTRRVPLSRIRLRIARHLVEGQHAAAMLTTFNEVDMSAVMEVRSRYKERVAEVHGVSLGLMSFFSRAAVVALREFPVVNAFIEGEEIVYHDYVHLGIAVSTERGLVVPVLRHAEGMSMAGIEAQIKRLAQGARDNKLSMDDLSGGTFTITNGGIFGSLLSTPILNAPQSAILGMHAIQQRPVASDGQVAVRPMMYLALSYDHRLIDGQTSVTFLVRLKQLVEDPARLMLEV